MTAGALDRIQAVGPRWLACEEFATAEQATAVLQDIGYRAQPGDTTAASEPLSTAERPFDDTVLTMLQTTGRDLALAREAEMRQTKLEEALRDSKAMAAVGRLVSQVAHEVRNPLFGLSATLDAFEAEYGEQIDMDSYLEVFRTQISRMSGLMRDLLELGKPHRLDLRQVDVETVACLAAQHCAPQLRSFDFQLDLGEMSGVLVAVDLDRFQQVLVNLLDNAAQHSPLAGRVILRVSRQDAPDGQCWVCFEVIDSGPGFATSELERVFEPFFSRRSNGTGLGLSIVYRIVQDHGGRVTASNGQPGGAQAGGGVVTVCLPVVES